MIKSLHHFPIGTRVLSAFVLVTLISLLVITAMSAEYYQALLARDQAVKISFNAQQTAGDQQVNLQRMNALLQTRFAQVFATASGNVVDPSLAASGALITSDILTREDEFGQTLETYQQEFTFARSASMNGVRAILLSDDPATTIGKTQLQALTAVAHAEWPGYKALQDQTLRLLNASTNPLLLTDPSRAYTQAYPLLYQANQIFLTLKLDWQRIVEIAQTIGELVTNVGPSQTQPIVQTTLVAICLTLLVIALIGLVVNLTITRPLSALAALTHRIAAGDLSARAVQWGHDEIATVADSMNSMLDHIVHLIAESETQRAHLQFQVEQFMQDVSGVGQGNLTVRADVTLADLGMLATSFNFMIDALSSLIERVKQVAREVLSSTARTSSLISHLVSSAREQLAQIQQASQEVEGMASASQRVAHRSAAVSAAAEGARQAAREGTEAVQKTVHGVATINRNMRETAQKVRSLQRHSSEINEISDVMTGIAQRTQRLALDAAIQVSLAETTHQGFAEVVREIRSLAEQAKQETEHIGQIVRTVIQEITALQHVALTTAAETERLALLATQTGTALEATFTVVERQADEIQEMVQVAEAQVKRSQHVVHVMQAVSQSTQRSSLVIQEVTHHVNGQGQLLLHLRHSVEAFTIPDERKTGPSTVSERSHQPLEAALRLPAGNSQNSHRPLTPPAWHLPASRGEE